MISEFFLQNHGDQQSTTAVSEGVLDLIRIHADDLGPDVVKRRLSKGITEGLAGVRVRRRTESAWISSARPSPAPPAMIRPGWSATGRCRRLQGQAQTQP